MFKSLLIFLFLYLWTIISESASCLVFIFFILGFSTLLTMALLEMHIIKKYVIADTIFHQNTSLFSLVKSVWFTLVVSIFIAFFSSVVLLVVSIYLDSFLFVILGLDVLVVWFIFNTTKKSLSLRVKDDFLDSIARRWTAWINAVFLLFIFVIYQFFTTPSYETKEFSCQILNFLAQSLHYKELLEFRLMSISASELENSSSIFVWFVYLFFSQGLFVWSYSKLLLSFSIPASIIIKEKEQNKNYFLIGFIATILLLFLISMSINHLYQRHYINKVKEIYIEVDAKINKHLDANEQKLIDNIDEVIDIEVDKAFEEVYKSIPKLSAYYYSVKGEYSRIILKGYSLYCGYKNSYLAPFYNQYLPNGLKLKRCNANMLNDEIQAKINFFLFEQNDFYLKSKEASILIDEKINNSMNIFKNTLNEDLNTIKLKHKVELNSLELSLNNVFEASSRDLAKKGFSATGTLLISGAITKSIMSKMLIKFGAKGVAKATTFLGGSVSGLSICAPTGPWALVCGVITGTATWVGVDAAMTEVDQAFNEDDFQLSVKKMIDAQKNTLKNLMKDSYAQWLDEILTNLKKESKMLKSPYEQLKNKL
ncbi:hypothetical protein [Sulfurimonas sp.]|uniref:hypothetical protein n=1 Tax=Sulfurimonas sp. TaxID=2022749 RepID=UPI002AAF172E|nr:hypothetical protein [Sulfurimonas sp.]